MRAFGQVCVRSGLQRAIDILFAIISGQHDEAAVRKLLANGGNGFESWLILMLSGSIAATPLMVGNQSLPSRVLQPAG